MEPSIHDYIAKYIASGRSKRMEFCREKSIAYHYFKYHFMRQHKTTTTVKPTGFIGLKVKQSSPATFPVKQIKEILTARLFADGKLKLEVQGEFPADYRHCLCKRSCCLYGQHRMGRLPFLILPVARA